MQLNQIQPLPRENRSILFLGFAVLFWIYACLFYTSFNYADIFQTGNRIILFGLIFACIWISFGKNGRRWVRDLRDPVGFSIFLYFAYILYSFILSILLGNIPADNIDSFLLQCFLPILFYFAFKNTRYWNKILYVIVFSIVLNAISAILTSPLVGFDIPIVTQLAKEAAFRGGSDARLQAFIGNSTTIGYFALICLVTYIAIPSMRFKYIVMPVMVVTVLLARQRGVWMGIPILLVLLFCFTITVKKYRRRALFLFILIPALGMGVYLILVYYTDIYSVKILLTDTLKSMDPEVALGSRSYQQIIYNNSNLFYILFGEGFGKYSPLIKENPLQQPDAPYFMIFNETGIIGTLIFFNMFFQIFLHSFKTRNLIIMFMVLHLSVGLLGSRYLWFFPLNFLFYTFVGMFQNMSSRNLMFFSKNKVVPVKPYVENRNLKNLSTLQPSL